LVWEGVQRVTGDVLVPENGSLTIRSGTRVVIASPGAPGIVVRGRLKVEGAAGADGGVLFFPEGAWKGISLEGGARAELRNALLEGGLEQALACRGSSRARVLGVTFLRGNVGVLAQDSSAVWVEGCVFEGSNKLGLDARGRSRVNLLGNHFRGAPAGYVRLSDEAAVSASEENGEPI
jgi:hypothetical protein